MERCTWRNGAQEQLVTSEQNHDRWKISANMIVFIYFLVIQVTKPQTLSEYLMMGLIESELEIRKSECEQLSTLVERSVVIKCV